MMTSLNRKLIRDLLHMRGQVIAIALVTACGVAAFVSMRNIYESLLATQHSYYTRYRFAEVFASLKRAPLWMQTQIAAIPGVAAVQTRVVAEVTLDIPGLNEPGSGRLISLPEQRAPMLNDLYLVAGRWIESAHRDEVIVSSAFAEKNNFKPGDSLSAVINGHWTKLQIVGLTMSPEFIYEIRAGEMFPDSRRFGVIWMGQEALSAAFDMQDAFNDVALTLTPDASIGEVITELDAMLERYGGLGAYGRDDQPSHYFVAHEIAELRVNGTFTPGVFLLVAAFLIHLVMSRLVSTQREQIAALKAFGYGNRAIAWHYLKLALAAISGGIVLGILVGWYFGYELTKLYTEFFRFPVLRYEFDPGVISTAVGVSLTAAVIGAIQATHKAVTLPPAEAMRPEPPARFQAGMLEQIGLQFILPLPVRIILRNIARNPVKALLTVFGIALSVSLLVIGFYFNDAIEQIIALQFDRVNREDANVVFSEPRPARASFDLMSLPGVLRVEPYRAVPVRLRSGHRTRRTALLGILPEGELQQIVALDNHVITLPPDGLILTTELAEILHVSPGDELTIEVLTGSKPVRSVPVAGLADEVLGLSAYLNMPALNRLLREGGTISGARLRVDEAKADDLYRYLKRLPVVGSVIIPAATLQNFRETIARTMGIMTGIIILFACIIALGMVYNSARIALSERGRELASLRVLGFTKAEVGIMLLGEQTLLVLLAIPVGWLIGVGFCQLLVNSIDTEMMRLPLLITRRNLALASLITAAAALSSALLILRRLRRLDLIAVLKTRE